MTNNLRPGILLCSDVQLLLDESLAKVPSNTPVTLHLQYLDLGDKCSLVGGTHLSLFHINIINV